jgi:hypothetical protein
MIQEERKHCGGDMTESEKPVESMKNAIQKVAPRLTKDCSVGLIEISQGNRGLQSVGD